MTTVITHFRQGPLTPGGLLRCARLARWTALFLFFALVASVAGVPAMAQDQAPRGTPLVPPSFELSDAAQRLIDATWLTDDERADLRIFHGAWEERDLSTPARRAIVALHAWRFDDPSLSDESVPAEVRAEALVLQGELEEAIALLEGVSSLRAARLRAEAFEQLGRVEEADRAIDEPVRILLSRTLDDASLLTEGVKALIVRSRLQGQPARDFQTMLDLLARARDVYDRLYWPAVLTEAELLLDKDNPQEAVLALHQALSLNPRCAKAWFMLGGVALRQFDFHSVRTAASALRRLNPNHPLAAMLLAESALVQRDPELALELTGDVLSSHPAQREALAIRAASLALTYDEEALREALDDFDRLSPGSALAYFVAGSTLSLDRQYEASAELLNEAVRRQPTWPAPRIELAMLELQSGRDALALAALREVRELDPFNKRVANSLFLLEELATYQTVETDHFIIRYNPRAEDRVMVDLMPQTLEAIHKAVATRFQHEPDRKTVIELMPDHQRFAVRIGGMPHIHTIAACTGPVIAMEVPREGPMQRHLGPFDWPRVLQHEYTHTITLSQTRNRIPHWLTEAAAVSMEPPPRGFQAVQLLVGAFQSGRLFDLDEINWAFVRPEQPGDRALAYAQGHWMVEFMNERFGSEALLRLLERYFEGEREQEAMPMALGISREEFHEAFLDWAGEQVKAWGYAPSPSMLELTDSLRERDPEAMAAMGRNRQLLLDAMVRVLTDRVGQASEPGEQPLRAGKWPELPRPEVEISDAQLASWLEAYPDHPDLVKLACDRAMAMQKEPGAAVAPLLERYALLRPLDPWPHRALAAIWQKSDTPSRAIPHLEELDAREQYSPVFAVALASLYRAEGDLERAGVKALRAVNINPYHAPNRELAAAISIEAGDLAIARTHVVALTILEPDRPQHAARLEAIERRLNQ